MSGPALLDHVAVESLRDHHKCREVGRVVPFLLLGIQFGNQPANIEIALGFRCEFRLDVDQPRQSRRECLPNAMSISATLISIVPCSCRPSPPSGFRSVPWRLSCIHSTLLPCLQCATSWRSTSAGFGEQVARGDDLAAELDFFFDNCRYDLSSRVDARVHQLGHPPGGVRAGLRSDGQRLRNP